MASIQTYVYQKKWKAAMACDFKEPVYPPLCTIFFLIVMVVSAPVHAEAQVLPSASSLLYDFDGNVECPTEDDAPEVDSREGEFNEFLRMNVDCSPAGGVFSSKNWPSDEAKVDTTYVGFWGEAPADAPFEFDEGSEISFLISRSEGGPAQGELMYIRHNDVPGTIGSWTLDGIAPKELTFSLGQIPIAAKIEFRFHAWDAESDDGALTVDSVAMSFAIAVASEENPEQPNAFTLSEPFPNPFTSATTLPIDIGYPSSVRIQVVDVLGRSRAILFDGFLTRGRHQLRVDGGNLPAGTYFLRVETADRQLVRKVVLRR